MLYPSVYTGEEPLFWNGWLSLQVPSGPTSWSEQVSQFVACHAWQVTWHRCIPCCVLHMETCTPGVGEGGCPTPDFRAGPGLVVMPGGTDRCRSHIQPGSCMRHHHHQFTCVLFMRAAVEHRHGAVISQARRSGQVKERAPRQLESCELLPSRPLSPVCASLCQFDAPPMTQRCGLVVS